MTSFILKIIGIITMLCDHSSDAIIGNLSILNYIGRIAFPIFAFQATLGYIHTKDLKNYIIRLFIFATVSQLPYMLFLSTFNGSFSLNILFTLLLGICTLFLYDKCKNKVLGLLIVIAISIMAEFAKIDYGFFGILIIFIFYYFKDNKFGMIIPFILLCFANYIPDIIKTPILYKTYLKLATCMCIPIFIIPFYNGKQGPKLKYFFYIFYPVHLLILWIIHMFI